MSDHWYFFSFKMDYSNSLCWLRIHSAVFSLTALWKVNMKLYYKITLFTSSCLCTWKMFAKQTNYLVMNEQILCRSPPDAVSQTCRTLHKLPLSSEFTIGICMIFSCVNIRRLFMLCPQSYRAPNLAKTILNTRCFNP